MDFTVRDAQDAELDEVGELTAGAYAADGVLDLGGADPYLAVLRDARGRAEQVETLVAVPATGHAQPLLGSVVFTGAEGAYAEISRPGEAEFRMLAVRPEGRGRGVGEALVRACAERARERGLRRLVLSSGRRMAAAHRLYGRLGFVRTPALDWSPVPGVTLLTFALEL